MPWDIRLVPPVFLQRCHDGEYRRSWILKARRLCPEEEALDIRIIDLSMDMADYFLGLEEELLDHPRLRFHKRFVKFIGDRTMSFLDFAMTRL